MLTVPYSCTGADTQLRVYVNGLLQGTMWFPVTGEARLGRNPAVGRLPVTLSSGWNKIMISSETYQEGRLSVDHILVESAATQNRLYAAANCFLEPQGNGCWDGLPQRESARGVYSGRIVNHLGTPGDQITLRDAEAAADGVCRLALHYCRGEEGVSSYEIFVNGEKQNELLLASTGGFAAKYMINYEVTIRLKKGKNTIALRKTGQKDQGIHIDAIGILCENI